MIDLSIIIVSWNTHDLLLQCLRSVFKATHGLTFEVLVVDNASTDNSPVMVREAFPEVKVLENGENLGFAKASNHGIRESFGNYVLLLNSDTIVRDGALLEMVSFLDANPEAGVAGSKLIDGSGDVQSHDPYFPTVFSQFCMMTWLDRVVLRQRNLRSNPDRCRAVDWLTGACLMVRRKAIAEVGLLDEDYFMYAEEMDWCWRLKQAGWAVFYVPDAVVHHLGAGSTKLVAEEMFLLLYRSRVMFFRKHYGVWKARGLKAVLALGSLLRLAVGPLGYFLAEDHATVGYKSRCYARLLGTVHAL